MFNSLPEMFFHTLFCLTLSKKIKQTYDLPLLYECYCVTTSFDLWISTGAHDVFALVIIFLGYNWKLKEKLLIHMHMA
jgi:hypothetical protein